MGNQYDSRSEVIWLRKGDKLPDTCCTCGMFTVERVKVKHVELVTQQGKPEAGCLMIVFTLVLHLLGPLGWLFSILISGSENSEGPHTVKKKSKIKISQCMMCKGVQAPEVIETQGDSMSFLVHPNFKNRLEEANREDDSMPNRFS